MKLPALLVYAFLLLSLAWCINRDINIEKGFAGDLRNRVVGARLEKDGVSPYFYKWKAVDGMRYYDPFTIDSGRVSGMTASPFFHHILYPVADWQEQSISYLWLVMEYVALFIMVLIALSFTKSNIQYWAVLFTAALFLFTEAWKSHIAGGQLYLFLPMFLAVFYWAITKKDNHYYAFLAGLACVVLILIRPNALVFFIPFLFLLRRYSFKYIIVFFVPIFLLLGWSVANNTERHLWTDYFKNIRVQINEHQGFEHIRIATDKDPKFRYVEGIDMVAAADYTSRCKIYTENGNFFVLSNDITGKKISIQMLNLLCCIFLLLLFSLFLFFNRIKDSITPVKLALLGFSLFMITDFFSPIHRHQYYTTQWLFLLLLSAAHYKPQFKWQYALLAFGLFLNIINVDFIKMEHTIGEYLIFLVIAYLSLDQKFYPAEKE